MLGTVLLGILLANISSSSIQPHRRYVVKGVWETKWMRCMYLLWQARRYQWCGQCRAASPAALSGEWKSRGWNQELYTLGIWAIKWTMPFGSGCLLTGLVQEFGPTTWPPLRCFSSSSSIKWSLRTLLQPWMTIPALLSWSHAECMTQCSGLAALVTGLAPLALV